VWHGEWGGPRHSCVRWKSTCLKGKGLFLAWFSPVSNFRIYGIQWTNGVLITVMIDDQLVCEKLTIFPYTEYIVEFYGSVAFLWYSQVQDRSGDWREIYVQNVPKQRQHIATADYCCQQQQAAICSGCIAQSITYTQRVAHTADGRRTLQRLRVGRRPVGLRVCVGLSVCLAGKCRPTVEKWLIGSGCCSGWWVGRLRDGCIRRGVDRRRGSDSFGGEFGDVPL